MNILYNTNIGTKESGMWSKLSNQTREQLKRYFERDQYLTKAIMNEIQANLGLDEKVVKNWFHNQRAVIRKKFSNQRQEIGRKKGC